ncbi:uncharacterized protein LOC134681763 [Mytilus trossulus]|uniref:uncharacterized protein LOC134681763 n=1 Tax=Mytilus trossulus TaxID=6551 RepID=UPI003004C438
MEVLIDERIRQGHDPANMYQQVHFEFTDSEISAFPHSPTALKYKTAYDMFKKARLILDQYTKAEVDTEHDCDFLQPAFHGYSKAHMCDNIWYGKFKPPKHASYLIDQYIKQRPDDMLSEFCKHVFIYESQLSGSEFSKFEHLKIAIRTHEQFAMKVQKAHHSDIQRKILATLYNNLGSIYTITNQRFRAIDSFQNAYDIDNDDHDSLFGIAWWHRFEDPVKAINLFHKYLDSAPECSKKYYDAYYSLSDIYISIYGNTKEAKMYYRMGLDAEKKQLPFISVYPTASKLGAQKKIERSDRMM